MTAARIAVAGAFFAPGVGVTQTKENTMKKRKTTSRPLKRFRVIAAETTSYVAIIKAPDAEAAEAKAHRLWDRNVEQKYFHFEDCELHALEVEEEDSP